MWSDASLENKVEELCRELGDRGKGMEPVASDGLAQQLSEASQRVPMLLDSLEGAARSLMAVSRQERKAVMQRVVAMQGRCSRRAPLSPCVATLR